MEDKYKKSRIREIDILRGLAIILMITGHSFIVHPINIHDIDWCLSLSHWIYTFHMELFFLLAGCVYHCSDYKTYIVKKFDRLAIPYIFFGTIALILHSIGLDIVHKQTSFLLGFIKLLSQGGSYWFLYTLFWLYLIFPIIERVCKTPIMEICVAICCILIKEFVELPTLFEISRLVYYLPYFVFGRYLIHAIKSELIKSNWVNIALFIISLLSYVILDKLHTTYLNVITIQYARAMAMIFVVYVPSSYLLRWIDSHNRLAIITFNFLTNCSTYSLQIYLFNGFLLVIIRTLLVSVLHIYNPIIIVFTIIVGDLLITLLICIFLLPRTKWLSWLCGLGKRPWIKDHISK